MSTKRHRKKTITRYTGHLIPASSVLFSKDTAPNIGATEVPDVHNFTDPSEAQIDKSDVKMLKNSMKPNKDNGRNFKNEAATALLRKDMDIETVKKLLKRRRQKSYVKPAGLQIHFNRKPKVLPASQSYSKYKEGSMKVTMQRKKYMNTNSRKNNRDTKRT